MENEHLEILNLESLAEMYFDDGKFDKHMALWSKEEINFESPFGSFKSAGPYLDWLKEFYEMTQKMGGTRHLVMNPVITIDGETAEFKGYLYIMNKKDGSFMGTSVMHDKFQKTEKGWKFIHRSVAPDQDLSTLAT